MIAQNPKRSVLIMMPEVPYPLRANGLSIRYLPIIRHLSQTCAIDLLIINKERVNPRSLEPLRASCREVTAIRHAEAGRSGIAGKFITRTMFFLPWAMPRSWIQYGRRHIAEAVRRATGRNVYDVVICVSGYAYPFVPAIPAGKLIVDFVDSPSLLAKRNVIGSSRTAAVKKYEWLKMLNWEAKIIRKASAAVYISKVDAAYVPKLLTPGRRRLVIQNGFSAAEYTSASDPAIKKPNIGFLGNMSYFPNVEAVHWLYEHIFTPLRETRKDLTLHIIGRDPDESIVRLGQDRNVHVTGTVENIWPVLNAIDVFVFPLRRGGGLKNKILEAMYAKRPVITTAIGNEGIGAVPGKDLIVCKEPAEFRDSIERLLESTSERERLACSGQRHIADNFAWKGLLETYETLVHEGTNPAPVKRRAEAGLLFGCRGK